MKPSNEVRAEVEGRVARAAERARQALVLLDQALAELSPIAGAARAWDGLADAADGVEGSVRVLAAADLEAWSLGTPRPERGGDRG